MPASEPGFGPSPAFHVSPAEDIEADLVTRAAASALAPTVWVTDLIDPRQAYWSKLLRAPLPKNREGSAAAGRRMHAFVLGELAPAEHREVRVRRAGIVGSIDLLEADPTELKTTARPPPPGRVVEERPSYIEQLAMYCALVGRTRGRLVIVGTAEDPPSSVSVLEIEVPRTDRVFEGMNRRAEQVRDAWARVSPNALPRCRWFGKGCEYGDAGACDCTGAEAPIDRALLDEVASVTEHPEEAPRLLELLRKRSPTRDAGVSFYRELTYPRQAYYDRTEAETFAPPEPLPRGDLWSTVSSLLEEGPTGELERRYPASGEPSEAALVFRGAPMLVKTTRARRNRRPEELGIASPHYFRELGVRCAALGLREGL
ncbi:MAG: PD-(D/E)XK nuclease family protein, partial [Thermoplasmata archaeon]|nr:PD-(D/E)XK nuclease family protein [Thermoplasmata archaeon]